MHEYVKQLLEHFDNRPSWYTRSLGMFFADIYDKKISSYVMYRNIFLCSTSQEEWLMPFINEADVELYNGDFLAQHILNELYLVPPPTNVPVESTLMRRYADCISGLPLPSVAAFVGLNWVNVKHRKVIEPTAYFTAATVATQHPSLKSFVDYIEPKRFSFMEEGETIYDTAQRYIDSREPDTLNKIKSELYS